MQPDQILCDRYQLQHLLGKAPGRQTWLAYDLSKQPAEAVVVKLLAFLEVQQWDDFRLFEREAQVLQQLRHPHIPRYRDSFTIEEPACWFGIVQDYVAGTSLKQKVEDGYHFSESQVRQIAVNVLHLLSYLHELSPSILHRDVKPSNLIWGDDNNFIYLVDFGAVQARAAREGATFTVVGTYGYAPLEQFGGRAVPASDLYGLGATLIYLLTGVSPAELPHEDLRIQFRDRVSIDPAFIDWIEVLVEPDVTKRFQSAREALESLRSPVSSRPTKALTILQPQLLRPPENTRVTIHRSAQALVIKIPSNHRSERFTVIPVVMVLGLMGQSAVPLLGMLAEPVKLLILALVVVVIGGVLYWEFLPTFVQFERTNFFIYKCPAKTTFELSHGSIQHIESVFHTVKTLNRSGHHHDEQRVVVIQTSFGEDCIGAGLSWEECRWLVDVIQDWLVQHQ